MDYKISKSAVLEHCNIILVSHNRTKSAYTLFFVWIMQCTGKCKGIKLRILSVHVVDIITINSFRDLKIHSFKIRIVHLYVDQNR